MVLMVGLVLGDLAGYRGLGTVKTTVRPVYGGGGRGSTEPDGGLPLNLPSVSYRNAAASRHKRQESGPVADHDNGYKMLFSHPEMVADLLRGFVREDWVKELDFSTLEKV